MKQLVWLIVFILIPSIMAYSVNTTITIDWVGSNNFYLRTESGDFLLNANESNQTDSSYLLNLTRQSSSNQTDTEQILNLITNVSRVCTNITTLCYSERNYTTTTYNELLSNWTRCNLDKTALIGERDSWAIEKNGMNINMSQCISDRNTFVTNYNGVVGTLNNQTDQLQMYKKKSSDNLMFGLLIGAGIIGVIWMIDKANKQGSNRPKQMSSLGFTGKPLQ